MINNNFAGSSTSRRYAHSKPVDNVRKTREIMDDMVQGYQELSKEYATDNVEVFNISDAQKGNNPIAEALETLTELNTGMDNRLTKLESLPLTETDKQATKDMKDAVTDRQNLVNEINKEMGVNND